MICKYIAYMISAIRTIYLVCALLVLPVWFCVWRELRPGHFRNWWLAAAIIIYSALSWGLTNGCIFLCYMIDPATLRGPEAALALFFGGIYLWVTSLPVFSAWAAFRALSRRRKTSEPEGEK